jgi:hypothetical protein
MESAILDNPMQPPTPVSISALPAPTPKRGVEFLHRRVLDPNDHMKPARYVVTTVRQGYVYYKFADGSGGSECCAIDRWSTIAAGIPGGAAKPALTVAID